MWFYLGGHAWFYSGGYNEIRSMSGRYASYWNAFLFTLVAHCSICLVTSLLRMSDIKNNSLVHLSMYFDSNTMWFNEMKLQLEVCWILHLIGSKNDLLLSRLQQFN